MNSNLTCQHIRQILKQILKTKYIICKTKKGVWTHKPVKYVIMMYFTDFYNIYLLVRANPDGVTVDFPLIEQFVANS